MPSPLSACCRVVCCGLAAFPLLAGGQSFVPQAGEYLINGSQPGDQSFPQIAARSTGGYIVWQDNLIDGNGFGIGARRLDNYFDPSFASFRVNQQILGDQEKPQITLLNNGGAAIVWQGGRPGFQNIYARCLTGAGTFTTTNDIRVNTYTNGQQLAPVVATLTNGTVAVAWSSAGQDGSMQGVFARLMDAAGQMIGPAFQVNEFTLYNQRSPAVAALPNGNFVVLWVSEQQRSTLNPSVDIMGRMFDATGAPLTSEFRLNTSNQVCANPAVSGTPDGGFTAVWGQQEPGIASFPPWPENWTSTNVVYPRQRSGSTNGWDIYFRSHAADGTPLNAVTRLNTTTFGDQYAPKINALGAHQLVVWTSLGQDGSWEGVYGRFLNSGLAEGAEFLVNTTTRSRQIHPAVASDGASRFLVAWSSLGAGTNYFDLFAQRYAADGPLLMPGAPFVAALSSSRLSITWPPLLGYSLMNYELYVDGSATPNSITSNMWTHMGLAPNSTHTYRLAYLLEGNNRSPLSDPAAGMTWGEDLNGDGMPDDWQALYWGPNPEEWPSGEKDSDGDGVTNLKEFQAGTNPMDPNSVLRTRFAVTPQGRRLYWTTEPGLVYQVQFSTDFTAWSNLGEARFAAGASDSVPVSGVGRSAFYRVIRLR